MTVSAWRLLPILRHRAIGLLTMRHFNRTGLALANFAALHHSELPMEAIAETPVPTAVAGPELETVHRRALQRMLDLARFAEAIALGIVGKVRTVALLGVLAAAWLGYCVFDHFGSGLVIIGTMGICLYRAWLRNAESGGRSTRCELNGLPDYRTATNRDAQGPIEPPAQMPQHSGSIDDRTKDERNGQGDRNRWRVLQEQGRQRGACGLVSEALGHAARKLGWGDSQVAG